jgi:DNA-binding transcriptional regulator YiaG
MTKFDLKKLKDLNKEILILQRQMINIEVKTNIISDTVKGSSPRFPFTEHVIKVSGVDVAGYERKVARIHKSLAKRIREALDKKAEILEYIEAVNDIEIRNILTLRYSECLTWEEIAGVLHMSERTVRRKYQRWWES